MSPIRDAILMVLGAILMCLMLSLSGCGDVLQSYAACPPPALLMTPACDADENCSAFARTATVEYTYAAPEYKEACAACTWGYVDPLHPVLTSSGPTAADCTYVFEGVQTCDLDGLLCRRAVDVTYHSGTQ